MAIKIFTREEIYDLVAAQYSAFKLEEDIGIPFGWYDFVDEKIYEDKFISLNESEEVFEDLLSQATEVVTGYFNLLNDLSPYDFDDDESFMQERYRIQESITEIATEILSDYCKDL